MRKNRSTSGTLAWGVLVLSATAALGANRAGNSEVTAAEIVSIGPDSLPGSFPGIVAFDLSPNGETLGVAFISADEQKNQVLQVGEWDLASGKLLRMEVVEGPAKNIMSNPQYQYDLRFAADGLRLVALTGSRVLVLDASSLATIQAIGLPVEPGPPPEFGWVLDSFALSGDGRRLGVISRGVGRTCGGHSTFRLFHLDSKDLLDSWQLSGCTGPAYLTEKGTRVLLARGEFVDAATGTVLRNFRGGGGPFLDDSRFLRLIGHGGPSEQKLDAIAIVDVATGNIEHQLHYAQYGISGSYALAHKTGILAVLEMWLNPKDLARDVTYARGFNRLILFRIPDSEPFYVSPNIQDPPMYHSIYMPRISADGRVVAYGGRTVHVLRVSPPN